MSDPAMTDHAELAALCDYVLSSRDSFERIIRTEEWGRKFTPSSCAALLAEIAALRGENTGLKNRVSCLERLGKEQSTRVMQQATRAKDAERQRDESLEALGNVQFVRKDNPGASESYLLEETTRIARTFLASISGDPQ